MAFTLLSAPFYGAWWSVALGATTVLYLRSLGFEKSQIGFLLGMIPLIGVISPLIAPFTARFGLKRSYLTFYGARKFVMALLMLAPLVLHALGTTATFAFVTAVLIVFSIFRAIGETAVIPWQQEFIPHSVWGKFAAASSVAVALAGMGMSAIAARVLDGASGFAPYQLLLGCGAVLGVLHVASYLGVAGGGRQQSQTAHDDARAQMRAALRDRSFMLHMVGLGAIAFVTSAWPIFLPLFMSERVGLDASAVVRLQLITSAGTLLSSYAWGAAADRIGSKPVLLIALVTFALLPLGWWTMPHGANTTLPTEWIAGGLAFLFGASNAAWAIAQGRLLWVKIIPPTRKTGYNAVYYAWLGVLMGLGPILTGATLDLVRSGGAALRIDPYAPIWAVSIALVLTGLAVFRTADNDSPPPTP
jgi:Na+/melibiose symporter-like transporter